MTARLLALLAPPLCGVCTAACGAEDSLCEGCAAALGRGAPIAVAVAGLDAAVAACAYDGVARRLESALKFGARLQLAEPAAAAIVRAAAPLLAGTTIVPVPPAPRRARWRGFDTAEEIARALSSMLDLPLERCLARASGPRQVGRPRTARLADPPRIRLAGPPPVRAALVDDVLTTGATLAACARALRAGGAQSVVAAAFARSTGGRPRALGGGAAAA